MKKPPIQTVTVTEYFCRLCLIFTTFKQECLFISSSIYFSCLCRSFTTGESSMHLQLVKLTKNSIICRLEYSWSSPCSMLWIVCFSALISAKHHAFEFWQFFNSWKTRILIEISFQSCKSYLNCQLPKYIYIYIAYLKGLSITWVSFLNYRRLCMRISSEVASLVYVCKIFHICHKQTVFH